MPAIAISLVLGGALSAAIGNLFLRRLGGIDPLSGGVGGFCAPAGTTLRPVVKHTATPIRNPRIRASNTGRGQPPWTHRGDGHRAYLIERGVRLQGGGINRIAL